MKFASQPWSPHDPLRSQEPYAKWGNCGSLLLERQLRLLQQWTATVKTFDDIAVLRPELAAGYLQLYA